MTFTSIGTYSPAGWDEWYGTNVAVDETGIRLARAARPEYVSPRVVVGSDEVEPVDVAVDECDTLFVLASDGTLYRYDPTGERLAPVPCLRRDGLGGREPRAVCVTRDTVYVADGRGGSGAAAVQGRVQAISKHVLQKRWTLHEPFSDPLGLATDGEALYVADSGPEGGPGALRRVEAGAPTTVVEPVHGPRDVAVDDAGRPVVLDVAATGSTVRRYEPAEWTESGTIDIPHETVLPAGLAAEGDEAVLLGADADTTGEPGVYRATAATTPERVSTLRRSCPRLTARDGDSSGDSSGIYVVTGSDATGGQTSAPDVQYLGAEWRTNRNPDTGRYDGLAGTVLDADEPGTAWHRAVVEPDEVGAAGQFTVRYFATDEPVPAVDTIPGIGPTYGDRLRAENVATITDLAARDVAEISEITGESAPQVRDWLDSARQDIVDFWDRHEEQTASSTAADSLLHGAEGQYLWVQVELLGGESSSPRLTSFEGVVPRQSYLRHLPAVYREADGSGAFMERFLAVFESIFVDIEGEIDGATRFLDPGGIPEAHLSWLGEWLALEAGESWSEAAMRAYIDRAPALYKQRGTERGLVATLELFLDFDDLRPGAWTRAMERELSILADRVDRGDLSPEAAAAERDLLETPIWVLEYADTECIESEHSRTTYRRIVPCPQCFLVYVPPFVHDERLEAVKEIVDRQTPAHAFGSVVRLDASIRLAGPEFAGHTYLGVNSVLSDGSYVVDEADLGGEAVLGEREPDGQLELQSRLDDDARLS